VEASSGGDKLLRFAGKSSKVHVLRKTLKNVEGGAECGHNISLGTNVLILAIMRCMKVLTTPVQELTFENIVTPCEEKQLERVPLDYKFVDSVSSTTFEPLIRKQGKYV
jgi:hypothetical protein